MRWDECRMNVVVLVEVVVVFSGVRHEDGSCGFGGMKVLSKKVTEN